MTTTTFFIILVPILAVLLLLINLVLAPHNPYQEKDSAFECGFHSFLGQNRTQFSVSFFIYGLVIMMIFFILLTLGFIFELGKNALTIDSRQTFSFSDKNEDTTSLIYITSPKK
jgi:NADH-ubiquinone oxidoreductase chain 3